jgi:regulator of sigma E protease
VGIAQMVGEVSETGLINTMSFTAMLSLNVGIFNALPVPPLDGSRILLIIVEAIRGKPLDPKKENFIFIVGFALLITLAIVVTYQDIIRLGQ